MTPGTLEMRESIGSITDLKLSELGKTASGYSMSSSDSQIKLVAKKSTIHSFQIEGPNNNDIEAKRCWPSFVTIITFLVSEQSKKKKSFQIGVFTVFIVVAFLTLLKNIVDVSSVAFVKIAQDQAGMSDFRLTASGGGDPIENGNYNF
jgi:hypothetical protein